MKSIIVLGDKDLQSEAAIPNEHVTYGSGILPRVDTEGTRCFGTGDPTTWFELRAKLASGKNQYPDITKFVFVVTAWFGNRHRRLEFNEWVDIREIPEGFQMDPTALFSHAGSTEHLTNTMEQLATTMFASTARIRVEKSAELVTVTLLVGNEYKSEVSLELTEVSDVFNLGSELETLTQEA